MSGEDQTPDPVAELARRLAATLRRGLSPGKRVGLAALSLIAIQLIFRAWATYGSWFMWDDYIFLADVARGNDDWSWLFHSHFSLFMPVSFLLVKVVGGFGAFDWGLVGTQILILQALASLACWWMLRKVFGDHFKILIPLAFYLFVPFTIPATVWWSVAINQYPHHLAIFGAITAHVAYERNRKLRFVFIATVFLALGFGSYIKAPLIVVVLIALSWGFFTLGPLRKRAGQLLRNWPAWTLYALATVGYAFIWRHQQVGYAPRQSCELPDAIVTSILDSIGTGMVGGPWRWKLWTGGIDPFIAASKCVPQVYKGDPSLVVGGAPQSLLAPPLIGLIGAWLVIAGIAFYLWAHYRNALTSLWFVLPYAALTAALVYAGRAGTFGSQVSAREIRYFSDLAAIMALAIGTMLLPIFGAKVSRTPREDPHLLVTAPRWVLIAGAAVFVVGSVQSSIAYVSPWHAKTDAVAFPERVFVSNVQRQISHLPDRTESVEIADVALPVRVANPVIYPYNLPSRKFASLFPALAAVKFGNDLKILNSTGEIRDAFIPELPRSESGPVKDCGFLVQGGETTIPIVPVVNLPWWVTIDYLASADGIVRIRAGDTEENLPVKSGLHALYFQTTGSIEDVTISTFQGITVCADNVRVGQLQAKGAINTP